LARPEPDRNAVERARLRRWLPVAVAITVLVGLALFVGIARATDNSAYCNSCHEMQPYYAAWTQGGHKHTAQCIDCHVNAGFVPRLTHKFSALGEVWAHVVGTPKFPLSAPATVPDSRCKRCHPSVKPTNMPAGFSHDIHAKQGPCELCHATTGHDVTAGALQAAGVYSLQNAALRAQASTSGAAVAGAGKANIPGHVPVTCSECHDLAATGCAACHKPPHEPRGGCQQCHKPGPKYAFAHPPTRMEGWQRIPCKKCHPVSYTAVNCTCHRGRIPSGD
jgi:cytochrome c nitrite reductase small subunit